MSGEVDVVVHGWRCVRPPGREREDRLAGVPAALSCGGAGDSRAHRAGQSRAVGAAALPARVLYPGSIERTSLAERGETKGCLFVRARDGGVQWAFRPPPARALIVRELSAAGVSPDALAATERQAVAEAPADAVLTIRLADPLTEVQARRLRAARLRTFVPETMNVEIRSPCVFARGTAAAQAGARCAAAGDTAGRHERRRDGIAAAGPRRSVVRTQATT